jgi:hypothetical protein
VLNTFFRERKSSAFSLVPNPDPPLAIPPHPNPFLQDVATISWWCDRHHGVASPPAVAGAGVPPSWLACRCSVFAFVFMVSLFSVFVYCRALFFLLSPLCFVFVFVGVVRVWFSSSDRVSVFFHLCVLFFSGVGSGAVWWWVEVLRWWVVV